MNELNYAPLEASERLTDAGIVLETEKSLVLYDLQYVLVDTIQVTNPRIAKMYSKVLDSIPAPSMAEIWRVLPDSTSLKKLGNNHRAAWFELLASWCVSDNPTDALIDLLIWDRKENSHD